MNKSLTLDIAKAICIILVVVGHYYPASSPVWYEQMRHIIYLFHMPLFMFASGYIYISTRKDEESYGKFVLKKVKRLMIPYFVVSFIVISIKFSTQGSMHVEAPVTPMSYLNVFRQPEAASYLWFIWTLWWIFLIVALCKKRRAYTSLFVASIVLLLLPVSLPRAFCLFHFKKMFFFFMLGVVCFLNREILVDIRIPRCSGSILFAVFACTEMICSNIVLHTLAACSGIMMILQMSRMLERYIVAGRLKWLMLVSASSYIIYLFHTTFMGLVKSLFMDTLSDPMDSGALFCAGAFTVVACGIICPIFLYRYVLSRNRITRFLFGLK